MRSPCRITVRGSGADSVFRYSFIALVASSTSEASADFAADEFKTFVAGAPMHFRHCDDRKSVAAFTDDS
jgi:hypothetical protein